VNLQNLKHFFRLVIPAKAGIQSGLWTGILRKKNLDSASSAE
jgi:hypothetical protein